MKNGKHYKNQTGPVRKGDREWRFSAIRQAFIRFHWRQLPARMVLNQDGSMQLCMGATEIGQGADTVFSQMAAETTGISIDRVYISVHPGYGYNPL